jgi:transcriptional regulator with XRE-family HTH domain
MGILKELRDKAALSQRELAAASGVHVDTIRKVEQGYTTNVHPRTARALARVFDMAPDRLRDQIKEGTSHVHEPSEGAPDEHGHSLKLETRNSAA